jgi:hypothetical protein
MMKNLRVEKESVTNADIRIYCDDDARWKPRKDNGGYYDKKKYAKGHLVRMTHSS